MIPLEDLPGIHLRFPIRVGVWQPAQVECLLRSLGFRFFGTLKFWELRVGGYVLVQITSKLIAEHPDSVGEYFLDWVVVD